MTSLPAMPSLRTMTSLPMLTSTGRPHAHVTHHAHMTLMQPPVGRRVGVVNTRTLSHVPRPTTSSQSKTFVSDSPMEGVLATWLSNLLTTTAQGPRGSRCGADANEAFEVLCCIPHKHQRNKGEQRSDPRSVSHVLNYLSRIQDKTNPTRDKHHCKPGQHAQCFKSNVRSPRVHGDHWITPKSGTGNPTVQRQFLCTWSCFHSSRDRLDTLPVKTRFR